MHVLVNCFEIQDRFSPHLKLTMHCIEALDKASINPGTKLYKYVNKRNRSFLPY